VHPAEDQVRSRESVGGTLAFEHAPTDPQDVCDLVQAPQQALDVRRFGQGPVGVSIEAVSAASRAERRRPSRGTRWVSIDHVGRAVVSAGIR
jgi:hypothetical protein